MHLHHNEEYELVGLVESDTDYLGSTGHAVLKILFLFGKEIIWIILTANAMEGQWGMVTWTSLRGSFLNLKRGGEHGQGWAWSPLAHCALDLFCCRALTLLTEPCLLLTGLPGVNLRPWRPMVFTLGNS